MSKKETLKLEKKNKGGGYRPPLRLRKQQARLLKALWLREEGVFEAARRIGVKSQQLLNWKKRGVVPFEQIGPVARKLKVPLEALNYEGIIVLHGKGLTWKETVKACKLAPEDEKWVLQGEAPASIEKLVKA